GRMQPRALMVPPGVPEFPSRRRLLPQRPTLLEGRAWSGFAEIAEVEVSDDGGENWGAADLDPPISPWAWRRGRYEWEPAGERTYELRCRATDAAGNEQPDEPAWNVGGYANNAVQRVSVTVAGGRSSGRPRPRCSSLDAARAPRGSRRGRLPCRGSLPGSD